MLTQFRQQNGGARESSGRKKTSHDADTRTTAVALSDDKKDDHHFSERSLRVTGVHKGRMLEKRGKMQDSWSLTRREGRGLSPSCPAYMHVLAAFRRVLAIRTCTRHMGRRSARGSGNLTLEAGRPQPFSADIVPPVTVASPSLPQKLRATEVSERSPIPMKVHLGYGRVKRKPAQRAAVPEAPEAET